MLDERSFAKSTAQESTKKHLLTMENRNKASISGVEDVESFDEETVIVYTTMGTLTLKGSEFRINKLNVECGELVVEGEIDGLEYSDRNAHEKSGGFFSKLFK